MLRYHGYLHGYLRTSSYEEEQPTALLDSAAARLVKITFDIMTHADWALSSAFSQQFCKNSSPKKPLIFALQAKPSKKT